MTTNSEQYIVTLNSIPAFNQSGRACLSGRVSVSLVSHLTVSTDTRKKCIGLHRSVGSPIELRKPIIVSISKAISKALETISIRPGRFSGYGYLSLQSCSL